MGETGAWLEKLSHVSEKPRPTWGQAGSGELLKVLVCVLTSLFRTQRVCSSQSYTSVLPLPGWDAALGLSFPMGTMAKTTLLSGRRG